MQQCRVVSNWVEFASGKRKEARIGHCNFISNAFSIVIFKRSLFRALTQKVLGDSVHGVGTVEMEESSLDDMDKMKMIMDLRQICNHFFFYLIGKIDELSYKTRVINFLRKLVTKVESIFTSITDDMLFISCNMSVRKGESA